MRQGNTHHRFRLLIFTILLTLIAIICAYENVKLSTQSSFEASEKVVATHVVEVPDNEVPLSGNYREHNTSEYFLAKLAMAEAEGEDLYGKMLVIQVVLNRVASDKFPDTVFEVITENRNDVYQFSPVGSGRYDNVEPNEDCWEALYRVLDGETSNIDALYFTSEKGDETWHHNSLEYLFTHGGHRFYK